MRLPILILMVFLITGCAPKPVVQAPAHCLTSAQLSAYSYDYLSRVAALMRSDARSMDDFNTFIVATKGTVNNYADVIQSSVYLSNVVRFLPIPYAGEVCNVTKIVSNTVLHLNSAGVALDRYKKSSSSFLAAFDKLNRNTATPAELSKLSVYADSTVMTDARELQTALHKISVSTAAMAMTAQSVSNALETTGGYLNQAKNLVGVQAEAKDKTQVNASRDTFNSRLALLNQKISSLENSADTHRHNIGKARTYAELALQIDNQLQN
ncbi:hypothetical protein [Sulfuricurvum sp.]|uniref:hypothetical protein n=1 Tax=Sulfuricurvum sp. TaxID=2025608 RepID=UPI0035693FE5